MEDSAQYGKQKRVNNTSSALKGGGIIGIDFGATSLRAALVSEHGLVHMESRPTPNQGSSDDVWQAIADLIKAVINNNNGQLPTAICAGVPSVVDTATGTVYDVQHIPACKSLALGNLIENKFGVLALINNDANAFALGEYYFGDHSFNDDSNSGQIPRTEQSHRPSTRSANQGISDDKPPMKSYTDILAGKTENKQSATPSMNLKNLRVNQNDKSLVGLTIGTGLGAGLILNGKLYSGPNCGAGEIGCLPYLDANLERYVSGAFFNNDDLNGKVYFDLAQKGDKMALAHYQQFGYHLGQAIKIIMYTYDPDSIVLGGSVSQAFNFFNKAMFKAMQNFDYPGILKKIRVHPSCLNHSAILGAASLYFDYVKR